MPLCDRADLFGKSRDPPRTPIVRRRIDGDTPAPPPKVRRICGGRSWHPFLQPSGQLRRLVAVGHER
jgi:hypothetical protein